MNRIWTWHTCQPDGSQMTEIFRVDATLDGQIREQVSHRVKQSSQEDKFVSQRGRITVEQVKKKTRLTEMHRNFID